MKRTSFTLIELLVVIGIIAILAALLMPALNKAREKAMQTDCVNNNKQLAAAIMLYASDNRGSFPHCTNGSWGAGKEGGWVYYNAFPCPSKGQFDVTRGTLFSYVNSKKVYTCKSDRTKNTLSYGMNSDCDPGLSGDRGHDTAKLTDVDDPTETPVLLEEGSSLPSTNDAYFDIDYSPRDYVVNRHQKGSVYSFADGHAAWEKWKDSEVWFKCDFMEPHTNF